jgi:hypothetical protein
MESFLARKGRGKKPYDPPKEAFKDEKPSVSSLV